MGSAAHLFLASLALLSLTAAGAPDFSPPSAGDQPQWESASAPLNAIAAECRKATDACAAERSMAR